MKDLGAALDLYGARSRVEATIRIVDEMASRGVDPNLCGAAYAHLRNAHAWIDEAMARVAPEDFVTADTEPPEAA